MNKKKGTEAGGYRLQSYRFSIYCFFVLADKHDKRYLGYIIIIYMRIFRKSCNFVTIYKKCCKIGLYRGYNIGYR